MSSIDEVIARSRQPGEFSERKRFTIARKRAIGKLRKFALANPYYYILELIQAAVANGAQHLDIRVDTEHCTFAYVGGGLQKQDLTHLFDYLFASKDRTDVSHLRELALGINAALQFKPTRVVVESGDGTLAGTCRLILSGDHDEVEIGTPTRPLGGTFVHFEGFKRGALPGFRRFLFGAKRPRELDAIEERCLAAPIPIIVNGQPLFGYSAQRSPALFGYKKVVSFDEGDLYGAIGCDPSWGSPNFKLLTWGVAIHSKEHEVMGGHRIGGVVCFDRLRKTVDHSGVVEDERLEEMWIRLQPYARQLVAGRDERIRGWITGLDGQKRDANALREELRGATRLVLAPPHAATKSNLAANAAAIGRALEAPVLCGSEDYLPALKAFSGTELEIITPRCRDASERAFYERPIAPPPARPWLTPPVEVEAVTREELASRISAAEAHDAAPDATAIAATLGVGKSVRATVFTQDTDGDPPDGLTVEIRSTGRLLARHSVHSSFAGHVLVVDLPAARLDRLTTKSSPLKLQVSTLSIAQAMAQIAAPALRTAFAKVTRRLAEADIAPGTARARLGLLAASRACVAHLAVRGDEAVVGFAQLDNHDVDLLGLQLLRTLDGRGLTLRDVAQLMTACHGLLYGVRPDVQADIEGLDRTKIVELDRAQERAILALISETAYVRVDARETLAEFEGVRCRDLAIGLRSYPDFPLLVEGVDPTPWPARKRTACLESLTGQLLSRVRTASTAEDPTARDDEEECRRHALRQLQWLVCRQRANPDGSPISLEQLPLFLSSADEPTSLAAASEALASPEGLTLFYGEATGSAELGHIARAFEDSDGAEPEQASEIVAPPFLHGLLRPIGNTRPAFDAVMQSIPASPGEESLVFAQPVAAPGLAGRIGVPIEATTRPEIVVVLPDQSRARGLSELAVTHGCVGWLRLDAATDWNEENIDTIASAARATCEKVLRDVLRSVVAGKQAGAAFDRSLGLLLDYAARQLTLIAPRGGTVRATTRTELADEILNLPVFPSRFGPAAPGWRLIRRFCALLLETPALATERVLEELGGKTAPYLADWTRRTLHPANVMHQQEATSEQTKAPPPPNATEPGSVDSASLLATVRYWMHELRPIPDLQHPMLWLTMQDGKELASVLSGEVFIEETHGLCMAAMHNGVEDPTSIAWLLLAVYAVINAELVEITNEHERLFQERVTKALLDGRLCMKQGSMAPPPVVNWSPS